MKTVIIIFACLLFANVNAQTTVKVNKKAPEILVTDWIQNAPVDKDLTGKLIVLEFWATWCGPCIAAVPHLNELQKEFNRPDLYFISMTDEQVPVAERILKRISFSSIVVTDTSKQTQKNYGDSVNGLTFIPITILIDEEGIIKWTGFPNMLTKKIMAEFIAGKELKSMEEPKEISLINSDLNSEDLTADMKKEAKEIIRLASNKKIDYYFTIKESQSLDISNMMVNNINSLKSYTLTNIYKEIFNIKNLVLPANLSAKKYDLLSKNSLGKEGLDKMEAELLQYLNLEKKISLKNTAYFATTVKDSNLLEKTLNQNMSSKSDAGDKILFTGIRIEKMLDEISKDRKLKFNYAGKDETKYDFIVNVKSTKQIIKSLKTYGLGATKAKAKLEFYELNEKQK